MAEIARIRCFKTGSMCSRTLQERPKGVFAAFPFQEPYFYLFDHFAKPAIESVKTKGGDRYGLRAFDARDDKETRDFMCTVCAYIRMCRFFVADLSDRSPNVYFELGMAVAMKRRFVLISDFSTDLGADIASVGVLRYDWNDLEAFASDLQERCRETFKAAAPAPPPPPSPAIPSPFTGSFLGEGARKRFSLLGDSGFLTGRDPLFPPP